MESINIEQIMEEIRADIKAKGYKESDLSFREIAIQDTCDAVRDDKYNEQEFLTVLHEANGATELHYYSQLEGRGITLFIKKIVRKLMKPVILPVLREQEYFNALTVRTLNQMQLYIQLQEKRINELEEILTREDK